MGVLFWFPILGYAVILPLCVFILNSSVQDESDRYYNLCMMYYRLVPFFSVLWMWMVHKEYMQGEGKEILILGRGISSSTVFFWGLNVICLFSLYGIGRMMDLEVNSLISEMILVTFFINGLAFMLDFTIKETALSMLLIVLYVMISNVDINNFFGLFTESVIGDSIRKCCYTILITSGMESSEAYTFLATGGIFWLIGIFKAKRL